VLSFVLRFSCATSPESLHQYGELLVKKLAVLEELLMIYHHGIDKFGLDTGIESFVQSLTVKQF
jgi:hypothetical protein